MPILSSSYSCRSNSISALFLCWHTNTEYNTKWRKLSRLSEESGFKYRYVWRCGDWDWYRQWNISKIYGYPAVVMCSPQLPDNSVNNYVYQKSHYLCVHSLSISLVVWRDFLDLIQVFVYLVYMYKYVEGCFGGAKTSLWC